VTHPVSDSDHFTATEPERTLVVAPYTPRFTISPLRALYRSQVQVMRVSPQLTDAGALSLTWGPIGDQLDPFLKAPGQFMCRLDVGFMRPGKDAPMPLTAGRAPDRVALMFFDPAVGPNGFSLVLAGDRIVCLSGPVYGTWEIRQIPEVAQDFTGVHHMEVQVVEVSQALETPGLTPFPGVQL
jgi:hypothetical protein